MVYITVKIDNQLSIKLPLKKAEKLFNELKLIFNPPSVEGQVENSSYGDGDKTFPPDYIEDYLKKVEDIESKNKKIIPTPTPIPIVLYGCGVEDSTITYISDVNTKINK